MEFLSSFRKRVPGRRGNRLEGGEGAGWGRRGSRVGEEREQVGQLHKMGGKSWVLRHKTGAQGVRQPAHTVVQSVHKKG